MSCLAHSSDRCRPLVARAASAHRETKGPHERSSTMTRSFRTATTGLAVAFLLTGLTASAHGFMSLSPWQTGIPGRLIQLSGTVVCTGCTLAEARQLQHDTYGNHLYQVTAPQGQLVLNIHAVSNPR